MKQEMIDILICTYVKVLVESDYSLTTGSYDTFTDSVKTFMSMLQETIDTAEREHLAPEAKLLNKIGNIALSLTRDLYEFFTGFETGEMPKRMVLDTIERTNVIKQGIFGNLWLLRTVLAVFVRP